MAWVPYAQEQLHTASQSHNVQPWSCKPPAGDRGSNCLQLRIEPRRVTSKPLSIWEAHCRYPVHLATRADQHHSASATEPATLHAVAAALLQPLDGLRKTQAELPPR